MNYSNKAIIYYIVYCSYYIDIYHMIILALLYLSYYNIYYRFKKAIIYHQS